MKRELAAVERILKGEKPTAAARELAATPAGQALLATVAQGSGLKLRLARNGLPLDVAVLLPGTSGVRFPNIVPGRYTLESSAGRQLWQRAIVAREVLSALAFPDEALPAAAQTETFEQKPTVSERAGDGALALRVFAGRESGTLVCVWQS